MNKIKGTAIHKMKKTAIHLLFAGVCLSASLSCTRKAPAYGEPVFGTVKDSVPVVKTLYGAVSGENKEGIAIFRGIPYGGPCEGSNRWKKPTPVEPWEGILDCTTIGPAAIQAGSSIIALGDVNGKVSQFGRYGKDRFSENCLVLNVLTPGIGKGSRPVIFYIHGGGFSSGSGILTLGADKLAREEDVVVVGVNHRLNVFGYLYLGELDPSYADSGCAGMLDVIQALLWVRDNIAAFGGDPSRVAIMGESGGGMKVLNLMAMPQAKGLFSRAIVESGSSPVGGYAPQEAGKQTLRLLERVHLEPSEWKQLLDMDANALYEASVGLTFSPVADGINLPYTEGGTFTPALSRDIPLLVGSSADEMGSFIPVDTTITWDNIVARMLSYRSWMAPDGAGRDEEKVQQMVERFRDLNTREDEPWHLFIRMQSLSGSLGDAAFKHALAKAKEGGAPVYNYFIERDTPITGNEGYRCAWHTADLPLQFRVLMYPDQEKWSKTMAHAWASFARTGSPSTQELRWPQFTDATLQVMVFDNDDQITVKTDPLKPYRADLDN